MSRWPDTSNQPSWRVHHSILIMVMLLFIGWCLQFWCPPLRNVYQAFTRTRAPWQTNSPDEESQLSRPRDTLCSERAWGETKYGLDYSRTLMAQIPKFDNRCWISFLDKNSASQRKHLNAAAHRNQFFKAKRGSFADMTITCVAANQSES